MDPDALAKLLRQLHSATDEDLRRRFKRSLSFGDGLFDRWERAARLGFGEDTSVYDSALIFEPVKVGRNTWVGPWTILDGSGGGVDIGDFCSISAGVQVYTHNTVGWALSGGEVPRSTGPVRIGDRCYIGPMSVIVAGVSIGDMSVVAAHSVVLRDVPNRTVVGGAPARRLGRVVGDGPGVSIEYD